MPLDNPNSTFMMRTLIEKYFAVEENGTEIPGLSSTLLMKDGFVNQLFLLKNPYLFIIGETNTV